MLVNILLGYKICFKPVIIGVFVLRIEGFWKVYVQVLGIEYILTLPGGSRHVEGRIFMSRYIFSNSPMFSIAQQP